MIERLRSISSAIGSFVKRRWYVVLLLVVIVGGVAWWQRPQPEQVTEYTVIREASFSSQLIVSGTLKAEKHADLKFQSGGRLAWVGVSEGDWVTAWQGIASLDTRQLQKTLEKELNDFKNERWDFDELRDTNDVISDNLDSYTLTDAARRVLDRAQFDLDNTVLDVEIQSVAAEMASIYAPFDGLIAALPFPNAGMNVVVTDVIATIVDPSTLYISADVDELDIGQLAVGQSVEVLLDAFPDDTFISEVASIGFAPVALSGGGIGYEVKIPIPEYIRDVNTYKLGMNGDVSINVREVANALILPIEAVKEQEDGVYVRVRRGEGEEEIRIETGIESDDYVEIRSGLQEGDIVITREEERST